MPELPEVEVIRQGLAPRLVGRRFLRVAAGEKSLRRQSSVRELQKWLVGRQLLDLTRRGKYLAFALEGGATLLVHLGMTGHLLLGSEAKPLPPLEHIHLVFQLSKTAWNSSTRTSGVSARCWSFRRERRPRLSKTSAGSPSPGRLPPNGWRSRPGAAPGPSKIFSWTAASWPASATSTPAKSCSPPGSTPPPRPRSLSLKDWGLVLKETRRILQEAIRQGGTTVSNYLNSQGEAGLFQVQLLVYGKTGEPCRRCGAPIARLVQAGRSSFFCPVCQKMAD